MGERAHSFQRAGHQPRRGDSHSGRASRRRSSRATRGAREQLGARRARDGAGRALARARARAPRAARRTAWRTAAVAMSWSVLVDAGVRQGQRGAGRRSEPAAPTARTASTRAGAVTGTAACSCAGCRSRTCSFPTACRHCEDPVCLLCSVNGIVRIPSGEITIVEDNCIGCGACAERCPYGNISMHPVDPPEARASSFNCSICSSGGAHASARAARARSARAAQGGQVRPVRGLRRLRVRHRVPGRRRVPHRRSRRARSGKPIMVIGLDPRNQHG